MPEEIEVNTTMILPEESDEESGEPTEEPTEETIEEIEEWQESSLEVRNLLSRLVGEIQTSNQTQITSLELNRSIVEMIALIQSELSSQQETMSQLLPILRILLETMEKTTRLTEDSQMENLESDLPTEPEEIAEQIETPPIQPEENQRPKRRAI